MSRYRWIALVALALAVLAIVVLRGRKHRRGQGAAATTESTAREAADRRAVPSAARGSLAGRVLDPQGHAIDGATVCDHLDDPLAGRPACATSGTDGAFVLADVP